MNIRQAKPSEAAKISEIALKSKAHWGYSAAFIQSCRDELVVTPAKLQSSAFVHMVCELDREVVGFCAIQLLPVQEADLDALFVHPEFIGKGLGKSLMQTALTIAKSRGCNSLNILSDPHAEAFYLACGAVREGWRASGSIEGRYLPLLKHSLDSL